MEKNEDVQEDISSGNSRECLPAAPNVPPARKNGIPTVFSWTSPKFETENENEDESVVHSSPQSALLDQSFITSLTIINEPNLSPDTWLVGGSLGCRSASLVFKSSALANCSKQSINSKPGYKLHVTYKVFQAETKLLSKLLECHGLTEVAPNSTDFNLLWAGSHPKPGAFRSLAPHQRINHFPRAYELTRKDRLYKNIERMQHAKGYKHFDFIPQTFIMPTEFGELCSTHHRIKGPWIVKPVASSRGRGIFIVETPTQVPLEEPVVVAKYLAKPLLVNGRKCDLRLYVAVTSFDPLLIYIYEEGLVRFATVKYDSSHKQLWNPCMHLCNYSINKYHSDYVKSDDPSAENVGHKWTLSALLRHLKAEGKNTALLMSRIEDLIIKSILASTNSIVSACRMFLIAELFGFDILIDAGLKPWLLEVNLSPSLGCDSPLDVRLKSAMLADLLTLIGIPAVDPVLRPTTNSLTSTSIKSSKLKLGNCRRVHSAEGLSNTFPKKNGFGGGDRLSSSALTLTPEESKLLRMTKAQFERRGGFVRIFPAADSWARYSQYLDPATGVPITGNNNSMNSFNLPGNHNYNLLLYSHLFPEAAAKVCEKPGLKYNSLDRKHDLTDEKHNGSSARQDRYERMLRQGHRSDLLPKKIVKEQRALELRKQVLEMLRSGKKMSQAETRKTFSHYLGCVLRRIASGPDQTDHMEIVLQFLQKASNYLRTPYSVKSPSTNLHNKDRAAVVAKQLNDFLYLYNRETEVFVDKTEKPSQIPSKLYADFLENARECDLEEILIHQTTQTVPTHGPKSGFQGVLKCIPNVPKSYGVKSHFNKSNSKSKGVKVTSQS